jgi:hypothetical protein
MQHRLTWVQRRDIAYFMKEVCLHQQKMTATSSGLSSLPPMVGQVLDSFELIVAPEVEQSLTRQSTRGQTETGEDTSSGSDATDDDDDDDDGIGIGN